MAGATGSAGGRIDLRTSADELTLHGLLQRHRMLLLAAVLLGGIALLAVWAHARVADGIHAVVGANWDTVLQSAEARVRRFNAQSVDFARMLSRDADVLALSTGPLGQSAAPSPSDDLRRRFGDALRWTAGYPNLTAVLLIDRGGRIVASGPVDWPGRQVGAEALRRVAPAWAGLPASPRLLERSDLLGDTETAEGGPVILAAAPIGGAGLLVVVIDAAGALRDRIMSAHGARTAETYAFDGRGRLLTGSRFDAAPNRVTDPATGLTLLKDPAGGGIVWTRMAEAALRDSRPGRSFEPYRGYLGLEVIGAWTWLPDVGIGLATEIQTAEIDELLRPLRFTVLAPFVLLAGAVVWLLRQRRSLADVRRDLDAAHAVGPYRLGRKLGEGGMGEVYLAQHALLARPTAVKFIRSGSMSAERIARFEREVLATSRLTHPNTVEVYDCGRTPDGVLYYAMEYLPGFDLARVVDLDGPQPAARVVHLLRQVCGSLAEAHAKGFVHRDIKPSNLMVCERGGIYDVVKVLDFGLVREVDAPADQRLTIGSLVVGTPSFTAPERLHGAGAADPRSDLYSVGAVAFFLLSGRPVLEGGTSTLAAIRAIDRPAPRLRDLPGLAVPAELEALVRSCLAGSVDGRPEGADVLAARLDDLVPVVGRWAQADARSWWRRYQHTLAETQETWSISDRKGRTTTTD